MIQLRDAVPFLFMAALLSAPLSLAKADENVGEKVEDKVKDVSRDVRKKGHRAEEKACKDGTMNCAGKKMKNRGKEAGDAIEDKSSEIKNKVD